MIDLYIPQYEDLWFRKMFLSDEATMSYNHAWGGTIDFLYDNIAIDNAAIALFLKMGFIEEYRTQEIIMLKKKLAE